jgi:hypothetical protein
MAPKTARSASILFGSLLAMLMSTVAILRSFTLAGDLV